MVLQRWWEVRGSLKVGGTGGRGVVNGEGGYLWDRKSEQKLTRLPSAQVAGCGPGNSEPGSVAVGIRVPGWGLAERDQTIE